MREPLYGTGVGVDRFLATSHRKHPPPDEPEKQAVKIRFLPFPPQSGRPVRLPTGPVAPTPTVCGPAQATLVVLGFANLDDARHVAAGMRSCA
ncbi:hypothetical protein GCM10010234_16260 [Streptomyces hawaiiensis]